MSYKLTTEVKPGLALDLEASRLESFRVKFNTSRSFRTKLAFLAAVLTAAALYAPAFFSGLF